MIYAYRQFSIFLIVGAFNTVFGYTLFATFIFLGCHYTLAVLLATCLGVLFNFKTTGNIVFKNKKNHLLVRFISVYAGLYLLNIFLIKVINLAVDNLYITGAMTSLMIAPLSFYLNKCVVFCDEKAVA